MLPRFRRFRDRKLSSQALQWGGLGGEDGFAAVKTQLTSRRIYGSGRRVVEDQHRVIRWIFQAPRFTRLRCLATAALPKSNKPGLLPVTAGRSVSSSVRWKRRCPMRRFSIRTLMAFVLVSAVGLAAIRNANERWAG